MPVCVAAAACVAVPAAGRPAVAARFGLPTEAVWVMAASPAVDVEARDG